MQRAFSCTISAAFVFLIRIIRHLKKNLGKPAFVEQVPSDAVRSTEHIAVDSLSEFAPSEGKLRNILILGGIVVVPFLFFIVYYKLMFSGLINPSSMDFAQLGRNLAEGRGFTTFFLRPLGLNHGNNPFRQADIVNAPLFPVLLALAYGIRGATDAVTAQVSGFFYVITVPVLYRLGSVVFSRNVGLLAALIFAANPLMLEYATSGLPITLQTFLMTSLLLTVHTVAVWARDREADPAFPLPRAALILAGILTGALYLTDQVYLYLIPIISVAAFSLTRGQSAKALASFALPLALTILPWMFRTGRLTGNPFFGLRGMEVWMGTKNFYPGSIAYRYSAEDLVPGVGLFNAVTKKLLLGAGEVIQAFPQVSASWMLAFLLPSLLFRFRDSATNSVRRVMMYCFLAILVGMLPFGVEMPLFACLIPAMLVFAIAYLFRLVEQSQLPRSSVVLLVSLLSGAVLLPLLRDVALTDKPALPIGTKSAMNLKRASEKDEVVLSDQPWLVAWHADRPAIWIPTTDAKLSAYQKRFAHTRWLFLTDQVTGFSQEWQQIYAVFFRWNQIYMEAKLSPGKEVPRPIAVNGTGYPLLDSLHGFTVLEPAEGTSPTVVIAGLPR